MKAVRYYGKEDLRIDDIAEPEVRPGTVKIAPAYTGICGSDVHLYFDGPMPPAPSEDQPHPVSGETLPVVMGHEFSGVVEEVGPDVTGLNVGDHVVVEPFMVDGTCPSCNRGDYHLCDQMGFIGISGRGGGLAEHIVVEERWAHPTGSIPLDQAALIEPLAVAHHGIAHAGYANTDHEGEWALVGGAGPIGLLTGAVLKAYGMNVIISEPSGARRDKALEAGVADHVVNPLEEDLHEKVAELTGGELVSVSFDAAGVPQVLHDLIHATRPAGRVEVLALHMHPYSMDIMGDLTMKERVIGSSIGYCNDHPTVIKLVQDGKVDLAPFITSKIKAENVVEDGFNALRNPQEVKILVSMN